jgi:hypothetical protein
MLGGRTFVKPLPFGFGSNGAMIDYGLNTAQLAACQSYGMKYFRDNVPWNFTQGSFTGIEAVAGTFSSTNAATVATAVAAYKSYGLTPILVVTVNTNPGLTSTWTSGPPSTPAQFAAMMAWLVAQPGLQGLTWELFNEPDSSGVGVPYALLATAYQLAYPAMKAADPTCTVVGFVQEGMGPVGYGPETYYNNAVASGILGYMDAASFHIYFLSSNGTTNDLAPDAYGGDNSPWPGWLTIANWQANRIAKGDNTPLWITEFGWNSTGDGQMTPQRQAQFYQNFLNSLLGMDPVNNVPFSSYLKVMTQYAIGNGAAEWGIYEEPAATIVTQMIAGQ